MGVIGLAGNVPAALKVSLTAAPTDGQANKALLKLLAKRLGVAPSTLELRRGAKGRDKEVFVPGLSPDDVRAALD